MSKSHLYQLDDAQHATVLAALCYYQRQGMGDPSKRDDDIHEIATNGDTVVSLDDAGIDELRMSINHTGVDFAVMPGIFGVSRETDPFAKAAFDNYHRDGEIEVDDPAVLSQSDEGAYVMAWVWVSNEDAGFDVDDKGHIIDSEEGETT